MFRIFNRRNKKQGNFIQVLANSAGQGVIEYILILVVGLSIVLGGVYQINDAFRSWATNYFSDYLSCIIESGELPAMGGVEGVSKGDCDNIYQEFSLSEGRPLIDPGGGGGNDSGGGGSGDGEGDGDSAGGASEGTSESANRYAVRTNTKGGSGGGRFKSSSGFDGNDNEDGGGGRGRGRKSKMYTGSTDASIPAYALNGSRSRIKVRSGGKGLNGGYYRDDDEEENEVKKGSSRIKKSEVLDKERRNRIKVNKIRKVEELPPDEPMTFSGFIRYLIIGGIIIALVVFIGGQALQLGKGMD